MESPASFYRYKIDDFTAVSTTQRIELQLAFLFILKIKFREFIYHFVLWFFTNIHILHYLFFYRKNIEYRKKISGFVVVH